MNRKRSLSLQVGLLAFIPILSTMAPQPAVAQLHTRGNKRGAGPTFTVGELLLYCQPNTQPADVAALAAIVGATQTTPLLLADCYKLTLPPANKTEAATLAAVAALKGDPRVRWVGPNLIATWHQTATTKPNDPRYINGEQWGLDQINMPAAWVLQKGIANVADIDTGVDQTIADLTGQYLADSYNVADSSTNIQAGPYTTTYQDAQHGVGTSGVMIAKANNGVGIASVCGWGTTKCLFLKVSPGLTDGLTTANAINALVYIKQKAAANNVVSVNMSFGLGFDPTDTSNPFYVACKDVSDAGIIPCVSAGNDPTANSGANSPSGYPFCVTVAGTGPTAKRASYSSYGKIDVAAPAGDPALGGTPDPVTGPTYGATTDSILTTTDGGYHYTQGTSFASPAVAGVVGLLRSVPGVTQKLVFDPNNRAASVLLNSANHILSGQTATPDQYFGYGIVDAYAALLKVSTSVVIVSPVGINPATGQSTDPTGAAPAPVETLRPTLTFTIRNVPLSNLNIVLQQASGTSIPIITAGAVDPSAANLVTQFQISGNTTGQFPQYTVSFRYRFDLTVPSQQETVVVTGTPTDPTLPAVSDTRIFNVAPHQFPAGLSMVSIPYYESPSDSPALRLRSAQEILGLTSVALYRWVNLPVINSNGVSTVQGQYASNGTSADSNPALASLYPTDQPTSLLPDIGVPDVSPIGNGYFLRITSGALVKTYGQAFTQNIVRVPLHDGWNMVGDPFPFAVAFGSSEVETPDGNRHTLAEAVQGNLMLPFIYRYIGGDYQLQQLPNGSYQPWEAHWIYVVPKNPASLSTSSTLTLLIPPTASATTGTTRAITRSATAGPVISGPGSWNLRLVARANGLTDSYNYIGMSSTATDGNDMTKAPKPPKMSPYVSLGISRAAANGGLYAQDLRPIGATKSWDIVVNTDQKQTDIAVQWPNIASVPRRYQLTLTDQATGQTFDMRSLPAYQFRATALEPTRKFTITATVDSSAGRAVVSSLLVNPAHGRGTGAPIYEISYNLSRSASVEVSVIGANGRVVSQVSPSRAATQGVNRAYWDGRDRTGRTAPSGTYVLEVRAQTPDGQVTREIQPMTLTGR